MSCADTHTGVRFLPPQAFVDAKLWAVLHQEVSTETAHWQSLHKSARELSTGIACCASHTSFSPDSVLLVRIAADLSTPPVQPIFLLCIASLCRRLCREIGDDLASLVAAE